MPLRKLGRSGLEVSVLSFVVEARRIVERYEA